MPDQVMYVLYVSAPYPSVLYVYLRILEKPTPPSGVPPLCYIKYICRMMFSIKDLNLVTFL